MTGKVLAIFMLTNMTCHVQNLESSQGQEISMEKSTEDSLLFLFISKYGFMILNLGPHLKTEFLVQVVSKTHSHKKPKGKKKRRKSNADLHWKQGTVIPRL